jgi:hypothetical protein
MPEATNGLNESGVRTEMMRAAVSEANFSFVNDCPFMVDTPNL